MAGKRVLWPRARGARRALVVGLERLGATVDEVPLYSAAVPKEVDAEAMARLRAGEVDIVTFASSSAVRNLLKMLGGDKALLEKPLIACIGPVTAATARRAGLRVDVEAPEHTIEGLLAALRIACRNDGRHLKATAPRPPPLRPRCGHLRHTRRPVPAGSRARYRSSAARSRRHGARPGLRHRPQLQPHRRADRRQGRIVGLDFTRPMLKRARRRAARNRWQNIGLVEGDATRLPLADESFDAVLCSYAMAIIPDYRRAIAEAVRVLKPGGRLVLLEPKRGATWWAKALTPLVALSGVGVVHLDRQGLGRPARPSGGRVLE